MVSYSKEALALLAWAYLELDEVDRAQALLAQILSTARKERMNPTLVQSLRVHALVLSRQEHWEEAKDSLEEALTLCRLMGTPYAEAKTLYTAGLVSHKKGELEPARQRFEAALTILEQLGERLYARYIEQLLGQENTGEQNLTLESSQQLDSREVCERESAPRSSQPPETSSRHISIDSPPGQASGPVRRG